MKKNKKYFLLSGTVAASLVCTSIFANYISDPESHNLVRENNSNDAAENLKKQEEEIKEKIAKKEKEKKERELKKEEEKKKFKKNDKLDKIVHKKAVGKSSATTGERLNVSSVKEINTGTLKDGKYRGSAYGYDGLINVEVTISGGKIASIRVLAHNETSGYAESGFGVINRIIRNQTVRVDTVSGATITSRAVQVAVSRAILKAIKTDPKSGKNNKNSKGLGTGLVVDNIPSVDKKVQQRKTPLNYSVYDKERDLANLDIDLSRVPDGEYESQAEGFNGRNTVKIKVQNNKIVAIDIISVDDKEYFTDSKRTALIDAIKKDINIKDAKDIDTISQATYSSNSILRASKKALKKYVHKNGVYSTKIIDGINVIRDTENNKLLIKVDKKLNMVVVYLNGKRANVLSTTNAQYIDASGLNATTEVSIINYKGNKIFDGKINENAKEKLNDNDVKNYISDISKPTIEKKISDFMMKFIDAKSPEKVKVEIINNVPNKDKLEVVKSYRVSGIDDDLSYQIVDSKYVVNEDEEYEAYVNTIDDKNKLYTYVEDKKVHIISKGNGNIILVKKVDDRDLLSEQIKLWKDIKYRYFVLPPLPDVKLKDGTYYGHGYGYKVSSEEDRWKSKVDIVNGKIENIKILNITDDREYVINAQNFIDKINAGKIKDLKTILSLAVELEKFYAVETSVENKFEGELPILDDKNYRADDQREKLKRIDVDTVSGATISTVGMVRSIVDALNKSHLAGDETIVVKPKEISITKLPKRVYTAGEKLELDNMVVKVVYTNATEKEIAFNDLSKEGIKLNLENKKVLDKAGNIELKVTLENLEKVVNITVKELKKQETYVKDTVGDYESVIFVRPPETGEPLNDGTYIGHGSGYYAWYGDYSIEPSYVRKTMIELKVKNGKVVDIRELHFGDDIDGGGIGYKARADKFKGSVFSKVKANVNDFIKLHIDLERYVAYRQRNRYIKPIGNDDSDIIDKEVKPRMRQADAVTGATYSSVGYSRAIAEALWKSSKAKNKVLINDMRLEDFDEAYKLDSDPRYKNYFNGLSQDEKRQYRVDNKLHQIYFNDGEKFDPTNLVMTVKYTDGSVKKIPFDKLEENGFKVTVYDTDTKKEKPLTKDTVMEKTYYRRYIKIEPVQGDEGVMNFITSSIFIK